jgi:dihydroxyacetone kinase
VEPSASVSIIATYAPTHHTISLCLLTSCLKVPGTAASESHLSSTEIEIGMGIHNEAGFAHVSPIPPLSELISSLLDLLTSTADPERSFLPFGASGSGKDEVILLTNNLGGLSELEMGGIAREAVSQLRGRGITVQRLLVGSFMVRLELYLRLLVFVLK